MEPIIESGFSQACNSLSEGRLLVTDDACRHLSIVHLKKVNEEALHGDLALVAD